MPQLLDFIVGVGPDREKQKQKTECFLDTTDHNKACSERFSIPLLGFCPARFSDSSTVVCSLAVLSNAVFHLVLVDGMFCISVELFCFFRYQKMFAFFKHDEYIFSQAHTHTRTHTPRTAHTHARTHARMDQHSTL